MNPRHIPAYALCWLLLAAAVTGCAGTRAAYKAADNPLEMATVVAEHYYALVREAADRKEAGTLTGSALQRVQAADREAKPLVVELTRTMEAYTALGDAESQEEMQVALNEAVQALNRFINVMREVRS